ncbi:MAG: GNAT family N-acetyltransferase [Gemmatimonadaceae bacterium]|jgi:RimJ/RimL family protein N-acetyltransferase|nr:GNAT family N-acetyltransferase [Gemmatimonadaceae bacterium]
MPTPTFTFRPITGDDMPLLFEWLTRPHVAEWWDPPATLAETIAEYDPRVTPDPTTRVYIALADGTPVGYIQSYVAMGSGGGWWTDVTDPGVRGIDLFLADAAHLGRGLGTAMVAAFVAQLFEDPAVTRIQIDPHPSNTRAIRCYEKAGFVGVGEIETPDGRAWFMELARPTPVR